jgi:polysaccharide export outer membrane protein
VDLAQMFSERQPRANMELAPGDTIYVHRAPMIYVYGEVNKAGAYRLEPHMTVMQAIALGGGINRARHRARAAHPPRDGSDVKKIDARSPTSALGRRDLRQRKHFLGDTE